MTISEFIAKTDSFIRPGISYVNPKLAVWIYSYGRKLFLEQLVQENNFKYQIDESQKVKLWDLEFQSTLFNAAGMFKNGNGYYTAANQGAGAFLAGTSTSKFREGNTKDGITHPFAPYSHSMAASNWMGLPNQGHVELARKLAEIDKIKGCPLGVSLSSSPDETGTKALNGLIDGLFAYEKAGVDFIEINESCPNVSHEHGEFVDGIDKNLIDRLSIINEDFVKKSKKFIPIIVKFSNDTDFSQLPNLLNLLISNNFDGVNFGNTSTNYSLINNYIHTDDWKIYKYFTSTFGGGISGLPLKKSSLDLCTKTSEILTTISLNKEFHILRTGGIFEKSDLIASKHSKVSLNQWFTGYFEAFSRSGHKLYQEMFL
jgi:dihydroorotate dehydrogenase